VSARSAGTCGSESLFFLSGLDAGPNEKRVGDEGVFFSIANVKKHQRVW
jgi:hypothetical protein